MELAEPYPAASVHRRRSVPDERDGEDEFRRWFRCIVEEPAKDAGYSVRTGRSMNPDHDAPGVGRDPVARMGPAARDRRAAGCHGRIETVDAKLGTSRTVSR
ncbi:hypothetical protein Are01nite_47350 [Actinoplanes regularis]|nr:hypothetical protein Are01nite_47350 [Actinoplanes regularis]